jgi:hypothetical protein
MYIGVIVGWKVAIIKDFESIFPYST